MTTAESTRIEGFDAGDRTPAFAGLRPHGIDADAGGGDGAEAGDDDATLGPGHGFGSVSERGVPLRPPGTRTIPVPTVMKREARPA